MKDAKESQVKSREKAPNRGMNEWKYGSHLGEPKHSVGVCFWHGDLGKMSQPRKPGLCVI